MGPGEKKRVEFYLSKKAGKALFDYKMIEHGDKVAVGVSGGKDSLSLLHILNARRNFVPIKYKLIAVHIDMWDKKYQTRSLENYFKKNNYDYKIVKVKVKLNESDKNCFWCSWNRRKALFKEADMLGCRKIALAHHLDDIDESILMNLFFKGEISGMSPKQVLFDGALTIIRPFAYVEERQIIKFSKVFKLPYWQCNCPNADTNKRELMQRLIRQLGRICPEVRTNIFRSLKRIKKEYLV